MAEDHRNLAYRLQLKKLERIERERQAAEWRLKTARLQTYPLQPPAAHS